MASWTPENSGVQIPTTTSWQTYTLENVAIDTSGAVNVALLIHVADIDLDLTTDIIYIADVHMNRGATNTGYVRSTFRHEFDECARFMMKSFVHGVEPDQATGDYDGALGYICTSGTNDHTFGAIMRYPAPMHKPPTLVFYSIAGATAEWWNETNAETEGANTTYHSSASGFMCNAASAVTPVAARVWIHYTAVAEIIP